jgi:hypothetical protein
MMFYKIGNFKNAAQNTLSLECPHCGHFGTFEQLSIDIEVNISGIRHHFGQRKCPRPECRGHIFTVSNYGKLVHTYPPRLISFKTENIPDRILRSFQEALICYGNNCQVSSAIMIRKTLEEICLDKGAKGPNLYKRLEKLSGEIVLPLELREAMQELRLLGNDAAHIEAETYEQIGPDEIEISIEFTKEILKGIYQYDSLLTKLRSLKKKKEETPKDE